MNLPGCSNRSDKDPGKRLKALFIICHLKTKSLQKCGWTSFVGMHVLLFIIIIIIIIIIILSYNNYSHFITVTNSYRFYNGEGKCQEVKCKYKQLK